ncbi:PrkA family serine protein kinase [Candidatus Desulforudis audaxviator]|uniref:Putative serine protein kinase, PrkA n=1 Tax=Desulforudis audaxviator (strain MP104C) TaxID=477974 RepID=B1I267_DESAP|nr:protein PrkA [Candidatus Desulforudis audaxviator]ACA59125.1 putative serine protein kinase, PrkA [Candidatus Desulforudis audaxviator MP104C]AZK59191.1 Serine protein kinase (prkA protein), P-loop containing [Candidatus Desulforudis audaxviator]
MSFLHNLEEYRAARRKLEWQGTFKEYLELVRRRPWICQLSHSRIFRMIMAAGVEKTEGVKRYRFFTRELFGLDEALEKLVEEYLHPAARRLDVRHRILLLMGPVSGGKSTLVTLLKRGLEEYSRTDEGAVYAIKGCPMHEEPLHLIPAAVRDAFAKEYNVHIEGELCPVCRLRVETEYAGRIEEVPVERIFFSEERRVGIGTFTPSDPKSQDIAELTGSIDFSTIAEYGAESDPRAYRFDGELNIANRGLMEFQEMLKCDEKFLWNLLSLSQEGNFKAGRYSLISADEMITAHTNESEYRAFIANRRNEALVSRMIVMRIPYNLRVSDEVRIYEKLINQSDLNEVHLAPFALRAAAVFSVLSRLRESRKPGLDLVKKMRLYDGEEIEGFSRRDLAELRSEHPDEGMNGVDPRYVVNRLSSALIRSETGCLNALEVLRALREGLGQHPSIGREEQERLLNFIVTARQEYDEFARREAQHAFACSYEESARILCENYLDNVDAYCRQAAICDPVTGEKLEPDERLMRSIEEQIGISENAKKAFREEILIWVSAGSRKGKRFDFTRHPRLREAIEKKLFADMRDVIKITTSTRNPDPLQVKRIEEVRARLVADQGYCLVCAAELLRYAGSLLNR